MPKEFKSKNIAAMLIKYFEYYYDYDKSDLIEILEYSHVETFNGKMMNFSKNMGNFTTLLKFSEKLGFDINYEFEYMLNGEIIRYRTIKIHNVLTTYKKDLKLKNDELSKRLNKKYGKVIKSLRDNKFRISLLFENLEKLGIEIQFIIKRKDDLASERSS